jgi:hypothetical protein
MLAGDVCHQCGRWTTHEHLPRASMAERFRGMVAHIEASKDDPKLSTATRIEIRSFLAETYAKYPELRRP